MTEHWRPPERVDGWKFVDAAAPNLGIVLLLVTAAGFLAAIYIATGWFGVAVTGSLVSLPVLSVSRRKKKQRSNPEARNARRRGMGPGHGHAAAWWVGSALSALRRDRHRRA